MGDCIPPDVLPLILSLLPASSPSRAAFRAVCSTWKATVDSSSEVWGSISLRLRKNAIAHPGTSVHGADYEPSASCPALLEALVGMCRRQRTLIRRLELHIDASLAGVLTPQVATHLLQAACGEGTGLTDVQLVASGSLPDGLLQVRLCWVLH
jgi:hypothetical protein